MAKNKVRVKPRDQKPFTRYKADKCSIAEGGKREYGIRLTVTGGTARERKFFGGRTWKVDSAGQDVQGTHDAGGRVGYRTVTLTGPPLKTLAEQAREAREAAAGRKQARAARRAEARERAAQQARMQPAERPDPRQQARAAVREQPRAAERPRSAGDERAASARARIQEAEARQRLKASSVQPGPAREPARAAPQPAAQQHTRPPRAIEPPRQVPRWLRNLFARPEPERQPEPAAARRHP
jgi:hypothetical protein